jgi:NDP-sugar pyrophosphorylase family protein
VSSKYNIKKSEQLKEELKTIEISANEKLVSYDVISLFTKLRKALMIYTLYEKWTDISKHTDLQQATFMKLIRMCIDDDSYFEYDGRAGGKYVRRKN